MKKLLKEYGFNSDMQYYEMIAESFLNGQLMQARDQFRCFPKSNKIAFLKSACFYWQSGINNANLAGLFDLI